MIWPSHSNVSKQKLTPVFAQYKVQRGEVHQEYVITSHKYIDVPDGKIIFIIVIITNIVINSELSDYGQC